MTSKPIDDIQPGSPNLDAQEQQFILESRTAFKSVNRQLGLEKQLKSAATLVGVIAILATGTWTINTALKPGSNPVFATNSLLVALETPEGESQVFRGYIENENDQAKSEKIQAQSLLELAEGDRVLLGPGARASLFALDPKTRFALTGPCDILVTARGIRSLNETKPAPGESVQDYLGSLVPPPSPPVYRNGPGIPKLVYPAQTNVVPGVTTLQWKYNGEQGNMNVVIEDNVGNSLTNLVEVPSSTLSFDFECKPGLTFYWNVVSPSGGSAPMQVFNTITTQDWQRLRKAAKLLEVDIRGIKSGGFAQLGDVPLLALYELLLSHGFNYEAGLVYRHLKQSGLSNQE